MNGLIVSEEGMRNRFAYLGPTRLSDSSNKAIHKKRFCKGFLSFSNPFSKAFKRGSYPLI